MVLHKNSLYKKINRAQIAEIVIHKINKQLDSRLAQLNKTSYIVVLKKNEKHMAVVKSPNMHKIGILEQEKNREMIS